MKKLFLYASLGALLAAVPALAADDHHDHPDANKPAAHAEHGGGDHGGDHKPVAHVAPPAPQHMAGPNHMAHPTGPMSGPIAPANHGAMVDHHTHMQGDAGHMQPAVNNAMMHGNSDRDHGTTGHGGNFASLHRNITASHHYHAGSYHRPHGYYAHRWTYGQILPALFFGRDYWIDDYYDYNLMDPPPGTVWVRYGDDALLIDEYTGEVIQVVYGIFY